MTPTARTLQHLRQLGYLADVVERRKGPVTVDLFGFIDVVALYDGDPNFGVLGIQCTTGAHAAHRVTKVKATPEHLIWLACGNTIEVWAWRKLLVRRGGKAVRWEVDRREIT